MKKEDIKEIIELEKPVPLFPLLFCEAKFKDKKPFEPIDIKLPDWEGS